MGCVVLVVKDHAIRQLVCRASRAHALPSSCAAVNPTGVAELKESVMGKFFLGWLLGVPLFVLVLVWLFFG
jgi:hypothetical protein